MSRDLTINCVDISSDIYKKREALFEERFISLRERFFKALNEWKEGKRTLKVARDIFDIKKNNNKVVYPTVSTSTEFCNVGGKLRHHEKSTCSGCYARKIEVQYPNTHIKWVWNHISWLWMMENEHIILREVVNFLIMRYGKDKFRWFESGDLASEQQLLFIMKIACDNPHVTFWLPTREKKLLNEVLLHYPKPSNLTVRVSDFNVDQRNSSTGIPDGCVTSGVFSRGNEPLDAFICPATVGLNDGCEDCTACYKPSVDRVVYKKH